MRVSIHDLRALKADGKRFVMLTAYDFPTAQILDRAGVPVLLVGDSVGRNVLGYPNELPVTMDEMLHHVKAVARGAEHAMVVGDMPFMSFQASVEDGVRNAGRMIKEGGAHAVKVEGPQFDLIHRLVDDRHPGDGARRAHAAVRLRARAAYKVQGRGEAGTKVLEQAMQLEKAGAFAIVLEAMPAELGTEITRSPADPDDRDRRRTGLRRPGAGHPRPARHHREAAEAREGLREPPRDDDRGGRGVRSRRRGRDVPRPRPHVLVARLELHDSPTPGHTLGGSSVRAIRAPPCSSSPA